MHVYGGYTLNDLLKESSLVYLAIIKWDPSEEYDTKYVPSSLSFAFNSLIFPAMGNNESNSVV